MILRTRAQCLEADRNDPLAEHRDAFVLPPETIYLDGNSLGALPGAVDACLHTTVTEQWGQGLIRSWNDHDWIGLPMRLGEKIAPLIGAASDQVIVADSVSVNLHKLLAAALALRPGRSVILSSEDNFPTDLYIAQGLCELLGKERCELLLVDRSRLVNSIGNNTAVVMLTHVDFRSGRLWDMQTITRQVHEAGALMLWDLAHSAGALPLKLDAYGVDLAVGCGYKYLNGGPGAPAFLYVAKTHHSHAAQPLSGWMGHAEPFAFSPSYEPAQGIRGFQTGTPPVLSYRALEAALALWENVDLDQVREKSVRLSETFIELVEGSETLAEFDLNSPRQASERGSHVAFAHPLGYAIMRALIDRGVIGDFREPDLLRFGFAPLYTRYVDVWDAVEHLRGVMLNREYETSQHQAPKRVT